MILSMPTVQCYIQKDNKVLMLHRIKKKNDVNEGKWVGVGGHIEKGESPEEAVKREIMEETGLTVSGLQFRGVIFYPAYSDSVNDEIMFLYTANDYVGSLIECDEGNLEWIDIDKICELNLWSGDPLVFDWMKKGKFFSGKIVYDINGNVVDYMVNYQ